MASERPEPTKEFMIREDGSTLDDNYALKYAKERKKKEKRMRGVKESLKNLGPHWEKADEASLSNGVGGSIEMQFAYLNFCLALIRSVSNECFVISPFSIGTILAMLLEGADDATKNEIECLLGMPPLLATAFFSALTEDFIKSKFTQIANCIVVNEEIRLKGAYEKMIRKNYDASIKSLSFKDKEACAKSINEFVGRNKKFRMENLVNPGNFIDSTKAILLNCIYFEGAFYERFYETSTKQGVFHHLTGQDSKLPFMHDDWRKTNYYMSEDLAAVELDLDCEDDFSVFFFMPSDNFLQWRESFNAEKMRNIMKNMQFGRIDIKLPKFKIDEEFECRDVLEKLGMKSVFKDTANFKKITDNELMVGDIRHRAKFEMHEKGIIATAVTLAPLSLSCEDKMAVIVFNRPFLFTLIYRDQVIFIGQIA